MDWKKTLSATFFILVVFILVIYWFIPYQEIEFLVSNPGHSNFSVSEQTIKEMQFHENMRYRSKDISYNIQNCPLKKKDEMERSINWLENLTILNFYEVNRNEEITITCDSTSRIEGNLFIAGEGGVTNVTATDNFNVIFNGKVLLLRESVCPDPIVGTHELLHALGFDHSDNPNNIMYPTVNCKQIISEDIINYIDWLYSFPTLPDLSFESASASMKGRYVDVSMTIRNNGLKDSPETTAIIYADSKKLKEIDLESIPIGAGRIITFSNILILQTNIEEIEILIASEFEELDKSNNRIFLKIKE